MAYLSKPPIAADRENADGIAQAVYPVDESAVGGNADFRGENGAYKSRRKARDLLQVRQASVGRIELPEDDRIAFLLYRVHPDPVGMEREVPRPVACGRVHEGYRSRSQGLGGSHGQFPDVNPVLSRIGANNPLIRGVRLHLVRVSIILMSAERETPLRRAGGGLLRKRMVNVTEIMLLKHRRPERPTCQNWERFEPAA